MRRPNCTCKVCGTALYRRPTQLQPFGNVYCSQRCYRIVTASKKRTCLTCNISFSASKPHAKFCSHSCANISRRGIAYRSTGFSNHSQARLLLLKSAFQFQCCMVEGCTYNKTYDIHRLLPGSQGGKYEIGNMFAICPNHHAEVSRGIIHLEKVTDSSLKISY